MENSSTDDIKIFKLSFSDRVEYVFKNGIVLLITFVILYGLSVAGIENFLYEGFYDVNAQIMDKVLLIFLVLSVVLTYRWSGRFTIKINNTTNTLYDNTMKTLHEVDLTKISTVQIKGKSSQPRYSGGNFSSSVQAGMLNAGNSALESFEDSRLRLFGHNGELFHEMDIPSEPLAEKIFYYITK